MNKIKTTHINIINLLGGISGLSNKLDGNYDKNYQKIYRWIERNKIPSDYWPGLIDIASHEDISLTYKTLSESAKQ